MKRARLLIDGLVQGVGFRMYVHRWAERYGVSGWVRNLEDGRVETVLEGEDSVVDLMIERCRRGPPAAEVTTVSVVWEKPLRESGFYVL